MHRKTGCGQRCRGDCGTGPQSSRWSALAERGRPAAADKKCTVLVAGLPGEIHKFRCVPHLTGRRFEHGVTDCYTLFRDAYHLAGIDMPDFEREDDWWRNGQNLYLDNMAVTGFYRVPLSSAQAGDILLCCFGASVANHAAIYCGNGELLHHLPEQLSKRERYSEKWQRQRILSGVTATGTHLPSRGFATIWPPPQPVCEHGSGGHPCPVAAGAGIPRSDERRLVPDTYCR